MQRPWWKKKRYNIPLALLGVVVLIGLLAPPDQQRDVAADSGSDVGQPAADNASDSDPPEPDLPDPELDLSEPSQEPAQSDGEVYGTPAWSACRHWRNVHDDITAGRLTPEQIVAKVQQVDGTARHSDVAAVREASAALLRTMTSGGSGEEMVAAAEELTRACRDEVFSKL